MIKKGSVVFAKSGGPKMIVNTIEGEYASCAWLTYRKRYETGTFHVDGLSTEEVK